LTQNIKHKILVVENDDTSFIYYREVLSALGFAVLWANNGKQGVDIFQAEPDINLVIMDIEMPIMNGYEASEIIKKQSPQTPIIVISAYAMKSVKEKVLALNCDLFLTKPIRALDLTNNVLKLLNK
jgi:CheY-like chemotaxis protein